MNHRFYVFLLAVATERKTQLDYAHSAIPPLATIERNGGTVFWERGLSMQSALPGWLRLGWLLLAPVGLLFAARIAWEKMVWTWSHGPQAVGFSLTHIHPVFSIAGIISCCLLMLWLIPAIINLVRHWKIRSKADVAMVALCLFVTLAIVVPDTFFARPK